MTDSLWYVVLVRNANGQYVARGWFDTEGAARQFATGFSDTVVMELRCRV